MQSGNRNRLSWLLVLGDVLVLFLVTLFGLAQHGELGSAGSRMLYNLPPVLLAWGMVAPFLGAYSFHNVAEIRQLWRPFYAMVLAGPMAAFLRAILLGNAPIIPVFIVVIGGMSALALLAWRFLFWIIFFRKENKYG